MDSLSVGQLAARAGLTVRALHHYDAIGLLRPERTPAGHRRYGAAEVERLQRITSLRALGVPLGDIGRVLDDGAFDPAALLSRQRAALAAEAARLGALADRIDALGRLLQRRAEAGVPVPPDAFLTLVETMNAIEKQYTPEQLHHLAERREVLGEETIRAVEAEWPRLFKAVGEEMDAGTDPAAPRVQALVDRWDELVGMFTGGDAGIRQSVNAVWTESGDRMARMNGLDPDRMRALFAYVQRARDAR